VMATALPAMTSAARLISASLLRLAFMGVSLWFGRRPFGGLRWTARRNGRVHRRFAVIAEKPEPDWGRRGFSVRRVRTGSAPGMLL
jgi:hypothetical protein